MTNEELLEQNGERIAKLQEKLSKTAPGTDMYKAICEDLYTLTKIRNEMFESISKTITIDKGTVEIEKIEQDEKWYNSKWVGYAVAAFGGLLGLGSEILLMSHEQENPPSYVIRENHKRFMNSITRKK